MVEQLKFYYCVESLLPGMMQGGQWHFGPTNGAYYAYLNLPRTGRNRAYGARLAYVPDGEEGKQNVL